MKMCKKVNQLTSKTRPLLLSLIEIKITRPLKEQQKVGYDKNTKLEVRTSFFELVQGTRR